MVDVGRKKARGVPKRARVRHICTLGGVWAVPPALGRGKAQLGFLMVHQQKRSVGKRALKCRGSKECQ